MTIQVSVKQPFATFQTQSYGERGRINFVTESNEEITIWSKPDNDILKRLNKGDNCRLLPTQNGNKTKYQFIEVISKAEKNAVQRAVNQASDMTSGFVEPDKNTMVQMVAALTYNARFYKRCYDEIESQFDDYSLTSEDKRAMATTMFLTVGKAFK